MLRILRTLFLILLVLVLVGILLALVLQNGDTISLHFLRWSTPATPIFTVVILTFLSGMFTAGILTLGETLRILMKLRKSRRMQELLEREVDALRNQPLYEEPPRPALVSETVERRLTHEGQPEHSIDFLEQKKSR